MSAVHLFRGIPVQYNYDNNNVITTISYELDEVSGVTKSFTVAQLYDGLNRKTQITDQGQDGNITLTEFRGHHT